MNLNLLNVEPGLELRQSITGQKKYCLKFQEYDLCDMEFRRYLPKLEGKSIYAGAVAPSG